MRKIFHFLLLCIFACKANASDIKANTSIAIVDVQMIIEHSLAVQNIRESIRVIGEELQKEMTAKEEDLKKTEQAIIKKRSLLKEEEFDAEVQGFNTKVSNAQRVMQEKKGKLEQAHAEAMTKVNEATINIIQSMSKEKGFNVVIPSSHVLYATDDLNITNEVIKKLNQELKTVPVNYK
jgi:Skp family chaperone for outer membrane proteins